MASNAGLVGNAFSITSKNGTVNPSINTIQTITNIQNTSTGLEITSVQHTVDGCNSITSQNAMSCMGNMSSNSSGSRINGINNTGSSQGFSMNNSSSSSSAPMNFGKMSVNTTNNGIASSSILRGNGTSLENTNTSHIVVTLNKTINPGVGHIATQQCNLTNSSNMNRCSGGISMGIGVTSNKTNGREASLNNTSVNQSINTLSTPVNTDLFASESACGQNFSSELDKATCFINEKNKQTINSSPMDSVTQTASKRGNYQDFSDPQLARGFYTIFYSEPTGAHLMLGGILLKYSIFGGPESFLGFPSNDESYTSDGIGRFNVFQAPGAIYWSPPTPASLVQGGIFFKYVQLGEVKSALGYPTSDEAGASDGIGRFSNFQHGSIYWTPQLGAHEVENAIYAKWVSLGKEKSFLGYPTSDEIGTPDGIGRISQFQNGFIYWNPSIGAVDSKSIPIHVKIDSIKVVNPRTHIHIFPFPERDGTDTDVISTAAKIGEGPQVIVSKPIVPPHGDVHKGAIVNPGIDMTLVGSINNNLVFDYIVSNLGAPGGDSGKAQQALDQGSDTVAGILNKVYPQYKDLTILTNDFNHWLDKALGGGLCDGVVARDIITLTPNDLQSIMNNPDHTLTKTVTYPGTDSAVGCGSNSVYQVTYTVTVL